MNEKHLTTRPPRGFILHPFLFALYPILTFYSFNMGELKPDVLTNPLVAILMATAIVFLSFSLITRNGRKGGLVATILLVSFFSYGHLIELFESGITIYGTYYKTSQLLMAPWLILTFFLLIVTFRTQRQLRDVTRIMNISTLVLVLLSVYNISANEIKWSSMRSHEAANAIAKELPDVTGSDAKEDGGKPDVYYIILDRYARADTLKKYFNYDNNDFLDHLKQEGFFVANRSVANYPATHLSLASSLNMSYMDSLTKKAGEESEDLTPLNEMIENNFVKNFMHERGYRYIHVGSWYPATSKNKFADENYSYDYYLKIGEFDYNFLSTTMMAAFLGEATDMEMARRATLYQFKNLEKISKMDGRPKYVFAHILLPHDPYVFGPRGENLTEQDVAAKSEQENYVNQLEYTNKKVKHMIDKIIANSDPEPVIILQSDEGPRVLIQKQWEALGDKHEDYSHVTTDAILMHMRILNAYYLPGVEKSELYDNMTPVNTFRLVFNHYFNTGFEILEDKTYNVWDWEHPYKYVDITTMFE